jgi:catalase
MAGITNNGGSAPNYPDPSFPLTYKQRPYTLEQITEPTDDMKTLYFTSVVTDLDFEQPRDLWENVFDDGQRERYVNVSSPFYKRT